ncbi:MAG: hypothetical protein FD134_1593 [Gallionellaceae bacterium]|nr:MAG: hypothetical protein FD134_1593 [Gallionellaceae bacterium]
MTSKQKNLGPLTFGLDIGIASVGWAVLTENRIVDLGVRCFDSGEDDKGKPHNQARRAARVARNRNEMRHWRMQQLLRLYVDVSLLPEANAQLLVAPNRPKSNNKEGGAWHIVDESGPWALRAKGLHHELQPIELARAIYHIVKHRGVHFFRKAEAENALPDADQAMTEKPNAEESDSPSVAASPNEADSDTTDDNSEKTAKKEKEALTALKASNERLEKYRKRWNAPKLTIGALAYRLIQKPDAQFPADENDRKIFSNALRNKGKEYQHAFYRKDLRDEINWLMDFQAQYHSFLNAPLAAESSYLREMNRQQRGSIPIGPQTRGIGETFRQAVLDLLDMQHPPLYEVQIKGMIGVCEFAGQNGIPVNAPRAPKNAFTSERATWLEKLNGIKIRRNGPEKLTPEERQCLIDLPYKPSKVTIKLVRDTLIEKVSFPPNWQQASFNMVSYRMKPTKDGTWLFVVGENGEKKKLKDWTGKAKERKDRLKAVIGKLSHSKISFAELRRELGLTNGEHFAYEVKQPETIPQVEEHHEYLPFDHEQGHILKSGIRYQLAADNKAKELPKPAWVILAELKKASRQATLHDWRQAILRNKKPINLPAQWEFVKVSINEASVAQADEEKTIVPLEYEDAQAAETTTTLLELKGWHTLRKTLAEKCPELWQGWQIAWQQPESEEGRAVAKTIDDIVSVLATAQTDEEVTAGLANLNLGLQPAHISTLQTIINFNKYRNLCREALTQILPHLEKGLIYSAACKTAGFNHSEKQGIERQKYLPPLATVFFQRYRHGKPTKREKRYKGLTNPVVARSFSQARLVFNEIVAKYGSPHFVNVETARDLSRSRKDRDQIKKTQNANKARKEALRTEYQNRLEYLAKQPGNETLDSELAAPQLIKMRLYAEQGAQSAYSQKDLNPDLILSDPFYTEIDHIWPRSKTFDNSFDNQVLVLAGENQNKQDRIPYDFMNGAGDPTRWRQFEAWVRGCHEMSAEKKYRLLAQQMSDTDEFKARNLVDTRYVTRLFSRTLREHIQFAGNPVDEDFQEILPDDSGKERYDRFMRARVRSPQGRLTDFLRGKWGLAKLKNREKSDLHHALDACVIAACSPKIIEQVNRHFANEERTPDRYHFKKNKDGSFTVRAKGEIISPQQAREQGLLLREPWLGFYQEVKCKLGEVFVSRRPKHKRKGEVHGANPQAHRRIPVPLVQLTEKMLNDALVATQPGRRRSNYEAVLQALHAHHGDAKAAFADGFDIRARHDKPVTVNGKQGVPMKTRVIHLPLSACPADLLKAIEEEQTRKVKQAQKAGTKNHGKKAHKADEPIFTETLNSLMRKSIPLAELKRADLTLEALQQADTPEKNTGTDFYTRNKKLLAALDERLAQHDDVGKSAFAKDFFPPNNPAKPMRAIRLPQAQIQQRLQKKELEKTVHKTIDLTKLKKKHLQESEVGSSFYHRNKDLLIALAKKLEDFKDDGKKAFDEPFIPPPGKSGKARPPIRSIRLPQAQGSGLYVRGGLPEVGESLRTEVYWDKEQKRYFFRPVYQANNRQLFGVVPKPEKSDFLFNLYIDDPIEVVLNTGEVIPGNGKPGYFVVYEGDGRMRIRTHDRPGKSMEKKNKTGTSDETPENAIAKEENEASQAGDKTLFRFQTGSKDSHIRELRLFKVGILGGEPVEITAPVKHDLA